MRAHLIRDNPSEREEYLWSQSMCKLKIYRVTIHLQDYQMTTMALKSVAIAIHISYHDTRNDCV
jgi:hypothetical protein